MQCFGRFSHGVLYLLFVSANCFFASLKSRAVNVENLCFFLELRCVVLLTKPFLIFEERPRVFKGVVSGLILLIWADSPLMANPLRIKGRIAVATAFIVVMVYDEEEKIPQQRKSLTTTTTTTTTTLLFIIKILRSYYFSRNTNIIAGGGVVVINNK